ncbi:MAG: CopG family transcriptional regulator [Candidatus Binatia bacterium]
MQVTSIELPDELYRKVKHQAVDEATSFKGVVEKALQEYLARAKKGGGKR